MEIKKLVNEVLLNTPRERKTRDYYDAISIFGRCQSLKNTLLYEDMMEDILLSFFESLEEEGDA